MRSSVFFLLLILTIVACNSGTGQGESAEDKANATAFNNDANVVRIRTIFEEAVPKLQDLKSVEINSSDICNLHFILNLDSGTKEYKLDLNTLDLKKMKVFEDEEFRPGFQFGTAEKENKITLIENGEERMVNKAEFVLPTRQEVENLVFATVNMVRQCQETDKE